MGKKRITGVELGASASGAATARARTKRSGTATAPAASAQETQEIKAQPESATMTPIAMETPRNGNGAGYTPAGDEIARLAYSYWEARGYQGGSPEEDWLRAEQELRSGHYGSAA